MKEIGNTNPKYVPVIANLMAHTRGPHLKKPSPWHQFTRLLNKWYLHCIQNRLSEACGDRVHWFFVCAL